MLEGSVNIINILGSSKLSILVISRVRTTNIVSHMTGDILMYSVKGINKYVY